MGFTANASSVLNNSGAGNAFRGAAWSTAGISVQFWISISCPTPVRTWKFGFRGKNKDLEGICKGKIEGSKDDKNCVALYIAPSKTYLGSTYQEILVDSVVEFQHCRLYCYEAEDGSPGLTGMQLFVYDE